MMKYINRDWFESDFVDGTKKKSKCTFVTSCFKYEDPFSNDNFMEKEH